MVNRIPSYYIRLSLLCILLLAAFLRMYRIGFLAEFLGDQGRTSIIEYEWLHGGSFPLAGPTTLTGQHLGPVFYYLLAPGYVLGQFNPVFVSVWIALLGVCTVFVVYHCIRAIYGDTVGLLVSLLYAVSPVIVSQDRTIWEPYLVPLFSFLYAYCAILQHEKLRFDYCAAMGIITGILVQLHYPNIFFIGLSGLLFIGHSIRVRDWRTFLRSCSGWMIGFLFILIPFLWYEQSVNFSDISGVIRVIVANSTQLGKRQIIGFAFDYAGRVFGFVLPYISLPVVIALIIAWCAVLIFQFSGWNIFWTMWFLIGVLSMARYNGVVYDHYLLFLLPPVVFAISAVLSLKKLKFVAYVLVTLIIFLQLSKTDIFSTVHNDIARTESAVEAVIRDAGSLPFSFTLTGSRSFSDLHYRYFFLKNNVSPHAITNINYSKLYIICDSDHCPSGAEFSNTKLLPVLCYDEHCEGIYPVIDLNLWQFDTVLGHGLDHAIYVYNRI
jgi:4-amino-4-deoxy-L-arabinose transferase-like glycosyltransferase